MDSFPKDPQGGNPNGKVGLYPCFGCGGPHPWSDYRDGKHVILCPNKNNPGVLDNATKNIDRMRKNCKKHHLQSQKRKNLGMAIFSDFDESGQQRIQEQVLQSMAGCKVSNGASVALLVTTPITLAPKGGAGHGRRCGRGNCIFIVDIAVLAAGSPLKQAMPIDIQRNLPHIIMQFGESLNSPNCPLIRCALDTCPALNTGSFHFYAAIAKSFPHCVAKVFAPKDYAAIVLSGIVGHHEQAAVTTKSEVSFQFHLPYKTKEGKDASFMKATGPHVSVNNIL
jgi:hypothetical protein